MATTVGATAIEALEVGDRVETHRGETIQVSGELLRITATLIDPRFFDRPIGLTLLRRKDWARSSAADRPGATIAIDLEELGFSGNATIEEVETVVIPPGAGRLVTATVTHLNDDLFEVRFAQGGAALRGTGAHPLYSLERENWVRVRDLRIGERLQTAEGAVTVEALEKVGGEHRVYNLEVEGEHEYLVGEARVRAHNTCVEGLLRKATKLRNTKGGRSIYARQGGFEGATDDFLDLNLETLETKADDVFRGTLDDGSVVVLRRRSSDGRPTLQIDRPSGKKNVEIRYNE